MLLAIVGLALVVYLVRSAGPARVGRVLLEAGSWLPLILGLEAVQAATDVIALRLVLGHAARRIPRSTWLRSSVVAYAMMILLPAGRAAGEVARGALFARHVGASSAATAGAQLQAAYLSANGLLSIVEWWTVSSLATGAVSLSVLLGINAAIMVVAAAGLLAILADARVGRWLERVRRRFTRASESTPALDPLARRRVPWGAAGVCAAGRSLQVVQYAVILHAVGGTATVRSALVVHGVHLVGATLGDAVPGQLGVVDATYRAFASVLGFADAPERALSIAFVAHASQLALASACVLVAVVTRRDPSLDEAAR